MSKERMGTKVLGAQDILSAPAAPLERLDLPEFGGFVYLRELTADERDAYEASRLLWTTDKRGKRTWEDNPIGSRARLVACCVCDAAGKRLFSDEQASALGQKSAKGLDRIFQRAVQMNGIGVAAEEEALGNSESAQSGASTSPSPAS